MSTFELTVELDEIQANCLTSLLHEREKLVDGMYEKVESHRKADKRTKPTFKVASNGHDDCVDYCGRKIHTNKKICYR